MNGRLRRLRDRLLRRKAERERNDGSVASAAGPVTRQNPYHRVATPAPRGSHWRVIAPPTLRFTGRTATGAEIRDWARANDLRVSIGPAPDANFAQLDAESALQACLWLKRFNRDTGYTYETESRDCDNFARRFRAFPDLFDNPADAQAAVFGIYAEMLRPFAGVSDAVHALNAVWTSMGVFVFEPQGIDLTYQRLEDWPNRKGISELLLD